MENNIPKIIHYCWFGNKKKPNLVKKCLASWKKTCPDYKFIEWNETNFDVKSNQYVKEAYDKKQYAFVSDFVRLWAVYQYGGIYLDTDVELINSINPLLKNSAFFTSEDDIHISTGLGFGAEKHHPLVKAILDDYQNVHFINPDKTLDRTTCPIRNTKTVHKYYGRTLHFDKKLTIDNVCFLPKEYFCPLDYETKELTITKQTYAIHWFGQSWMNPFEKFRKTAKRFLTKIIGATR